MVLSDGAQGTMDGKGKCGMQLLQEEGEEEMFSEDRVRAG